MLLEIGLLLLSDQRVERRHSLLLRRPQQRRLADIGDWEVEGDGRSPEPRRVGAEMVSAGFFEILGIKAQRGRTFSPDEDRVPDEKPVAIVSHTLWTTEFGADPTIVGRSITLNDRQFTVVGVMPDGFRGLSFDSDVWVPMAMISITGSRSQNLTELLIRLANNCCNWRA